MDQAQKDRTGEILLAVVDKLIAFRINHWNTNKLEFKELHTYLSSIQYSLLATNWLARNY